MTFEEIKNRIDFVSINDLRIKYKKIIDRRFAIYVIISLLLLISSIIYLWSEAGAIAAIVISFLISVAFFGILYRLFIYKYELRFKKAFNERLLVDLIKEMGYDLKLNIENPLSKSDFLQGKLFTNFNNYTAEELFEGTIEKTYVKFTEVELKMNTRYSSKTIFRGFYSNFKYEINKNLIIDVIKDDSYDMSFLQKLNLKRDKLVKINNDEFEKKYVVYSNQPEFASSLISDLLIENLYVLSNSFESQIYFSIRNGLIHIAYNDGIDHFNIDYAKPIEELAQNFHSDITKMYDRMVKIKVFIESQIIPKIGTN